MPSQPSDHPTGVGRFGMELSRQLMARQRNSYSLRSQFRQSQLDPAFTAMRTITAIKPVSKHAFEMIGSSLMAPFDRSVRTMDLVVNLDPLGLFLGAATRITIVHDLYFAAMPGLYSRFAVAKAWLLHHMVLGRSKVIVAISQSTARDIKRHFPHLAGRVRVILSDSTMRAVADSTWLTRLKALRFVLTVANATPNKNLETLAKAFCIAAATDPALMLVHAGRDGDDRMRRALAEHGYADRLIRYTGITDEELAALYQSALCLVVPSLYEGFCLPVIEAQRYGCPVLFADAPGTAEIGGDGGLRFDPRDIQGLAQLLQQVLHAPLLRAELRARGYRNAQRFSWERAAAAYEQLFEDVALGIPMMSPVDPPAV
ncbi:glycosyltransferase family 1 protein [Sphingomonas sp. CARO-RG-8B-R24-01]|uniref:glycosyltransferase family 4 protein n=1 Tax=Sphingomonas sp. CARO-RG-8B-R24-01 TaxID=2914831 RepID=UPI001F55D9DF|nr:glycosyltransferase family 1 protein [Sphingomonas sp. CARO-RG-8B-R24-01]